MTKVEELRAYIIARCMTVDPHEAVDALIAAVRADERERIRKYCDTHPFMRPQDAIDAALAPATKSVPSVTVTDYDGPVTSTDCPIENAGYVQTSDKESK